MASYGPQSSIAHQCRILAHFSALKRQRGRALPVAGRDSRQHVVIIGGGFAGLAAAVALHRFPVRVTLIDRRNYHLFRPLLYEVVTAGLSPGDIASPIRPTLSRQRNAIVPSSRSPGIDVAGKAVLTEETRVAYDQLVIATGARHIRPQTMA